MVPPFGLYARIDACLSGTAGPDGLRRLSEAAGVEALVQGLRAYPSYVPWLAKLGEAPGARVDRVALERALQPKPAADLLKLLPFTSAEPRNFVKTLLRRFETENLKRTLRRLLRAKAGETLPPPFLCDLGTAATVPVRRLREAASVADLVAGLAGTPFQRVLADALPAAEQAGSVFPLERALDHLQLSSCWFAAGRLAGADREGVRSLLGTEADVLSVLWAFRARHLYGLRPDEILPAMPPFGRRLAAQGRRALCEAADPAAFASVLAAGPYASMLEEDRTLVPDLVEVRGARLLWREARAMRAGSRTGLGQVVAFLWIVDREVRDVGALAECLHYGVDRAAMGRQVPGWPS